jgi:hypothetical protein
MANEENKESKTEPKQSVQRVMQAVRTADGKTKVLELTRRRSIRLFCTECMGFQGGLVEGCTDKLCPLFPFRKATIAAYHADSKEEFEEDLDQE